MNNFKLFVFAANHNGSKIFCRFTLNKKTLIKGYYDFDKEKFIITDYSNKNIPKNMGKQKIKKELEKILNLDYDWKL